MLCALAMAIVPTAQAQSEWVANATTESSQRRPAVSGGDVDGRFVVAWTSLGQDGDVEGAYARVFGQDDSPVSGEIQLDTDSSGMQYSPDVAMRTDGSFVAAWGAEHPDNLLDVRMTLFDRDGVRLLEPITVNQTLAHSQTAPAVAAAPDGSFCVVWHSWEEDGGDRGVYGRCFGSDGSAMADQFQINQTTAYSQANPRIAMDSSGAFTVVWESWTEDQPGVWSYDVFLRVYGADGLPQADEQRANEYTDGNQWHTDVARAQDGTSVVVWTSWGEDGDGGTVMLRRFNREGMPDSTPIQVNRTVADYQWLPVVSLSEDRTAIVAWSSYGQDGSAEGVYYTTVSTAGEVGPETLANGRTIGYQWEPAIDVAGSDVLLSWSGWGQDGSEYGVIVRHFQVTSVALEADLAPSGSGFHAYPNPAQGDTWVVFDAPVVAPATLRILDALGREIHGQNLHSGSLRARLDWQAPVAGVYFIQVLQHGRRTTVPLFSL